MHFSEKKKHVDQYFELFNNFSEAHSQGQISKKHLIGHFFLQNHPQEAIPFFADRIFNKITEIYHCLFQAICLTKS